MERRGGNVMTTFETIIFGFYVGVGFICAQTLFRLMLFILKEAYIKYLIKKITKKEKEPKRPSGMEFGKFND